MMSWCEPLVLILVWWILSSIKIMLKLTLVWWVKTVHFSINAVKTKSLSYLWRQSKICSIRVARPTHLQNINPDSDKPEKCRKKFLIAKHFFESSFATSFCLLNPHWVLFEFFHVPLLKFSIQNSATRWGQYPWGPKIRSSFKVHACVRTINLANQRWRQEILMTADLILRDLLDLKNPTKSTTDRPTGFEDLFWREQNIF